MTLHYWSNNFFTFDARSVGGSSEFDDPKVDGKRYSHQIVLYGQTVNWLPGRHYDAKQLEPYRLIGDVEMDRILELNSKYKKASGDADAGARFADTVDACERLYLAHYSTSTTNSNINNNNNNNDNSNTKNSTINQTPLNDRDRAMIEFYRHYHDYTPKWVDWEQLQRGMDVFINYSIVAGQALYYLSLVPGFSIPKILKVLERTRYLTPPSSAEQVAVRLMDTGGFIATAMMTNRSTPASQYTTMNANDDEDRSSTSSSSTTTTFVPAQSLRPGGSAWKMALQVRALHAKVRRSILQNNSTISSNEWDVDTYGVPINQEDMAATLLAFSVNVLMGIEFTAGVALSLQEQRDYIALWRYIGFLLGVETVEDDHDHDHRTQFTFSTCSDLPPLDPCGVYAGGTGLDVDGDDCVVHARATLESMIVHLMQPNEASVKIAKHLLGVNRQRSTSGKGKISPADAGDESFAYIYKCFMCRRHIGDPLADALELPKPGGVFSITRFCAYSLTTLMLIFLRVYTLATMKSSMFRRFVYSQHIRMMDGFLGAWGRMHDERMRKAAVVAMKLKGLSNVQTGDSTTKYVYSCPFALVMPPNGDDAFKVKKS